LCETFYQTVGGQELCCIEISSIYCA